MPFGRKRNHRSRSRDRSSRFNKRNKNGTTNRRRSADRLMKQIHTKYNNDATIVTRPNHGIKKQPNVQSAKTATKAVVEEDELSDEETEEQMLARIAEERRKRRQQIIEKHKLESKNKSNNVTNDVTTLSNKQEFIEKACVSNSVNVSNKADSTASETDMFASSKNGNEEGKQRNSDMFAPSNKSAMKPIENHSKSDMFSEPNKGAIKPLENEFNSDMFASSNSANAAKESSNGTKKTPEASIPSITMSNDNADVNQNPDDAFDIFAITSESDIPSKSLTIVKQTSNGNEHAALNDNWDDEEGYYKVQIGEILKDRYLVRGHHGSGVFSNVLFCDDLKSTKNEDDKTKKDKVKSDKTKQSVAIKVIRNNESMRRAYTKELALLREVRDSDPNDTKHCVRLIEEFEHRNHPCLVLENMELNLRETLAKFGKGVGINMQGVQRFSRQLLIALAHLKSLGIVHADLKPDNILIDSRQILKVCDFGSAFHETDPDNLITPYLVSRFYRAPEIIMGLKYDFNVDTWAAACCMYELYVGHILFAGKTNNEMLKKMMDKKGKFPNKMVRRHIQAYATLEREPHFTEELKFVYHDQDVITGEPIVKQLVMSEKPNGKDIKATLLQARSATENRKAVGFMGNLVSGLLGLDPAKRLSVDEALKHPFLLHKFN